MTDSGNDALLSERVDGVLTLTLNRPDALNALRPEMLVGLGQEIRAADADDQVSVVVLRGAGRAFSAGVDLKVLQGISAEAGKIGDVFDAPAADVAQAMRESSKPIIARVHGACFTGALEIALHCDFIYASTETRFGDTHTRFGLRPTWGMSQTLSRAVGIRRAKELSYSGVTFSAAEARAWGLVNQVFEDEERLDAALAQLCSRIAANSASAVAAMKDLYRIAEEELGISAGLQAEADSVYPGIADTQERLDGFKRS